MLHRSEVSISLNTAISNFKRPLSKRACCRPARQHAPCLAGCDWSAREPTRGAPCWPPRQPRALATSAPAQHGRAACPACLCTGEKLQLDGGIASGASPPAHRCLPCAAAWLTRSPCFVCAQDVAAETLGAAAALHRQHPCSTRRLASAAASAAGGLLRRQAAAGEHSPREPRARRERAASAALAATAGPARGSSGLITARLSPSILSEYQVAWSQ